MRFDQAGWAVLPERIKAYIRELRYEAAMYRTERNRIRANLDDLERKYAAQAPLLANAIERLAEYEDLRAEYGIRP